MRTLGWIVASGALLAGTSAQAQPMVIADSGDTAFVLAASILALIAILPGLALFYSRARVEQTGFALFGGIALASLLFAAIGYSLAFGAGSSLLGGLGNAMFANFADVLDGATISEAAYAVFETVAALFAVGIVAGSIADRRRPGWLVPFAGIWMLLVYVPVAHWVWPGWLGDLGTLDYAGGIVVQLTAGMAALVIGFLLRTPSTPEVTPEPAWTIAGAGLLWVGFLAFFGGAALGGSDDAATSILNGHLAASTAICVGMVLTRGASAQRVARDAIAGLAAVAAAGALIGTAGAMALGVIGALAAWAAGGFVARAKLGGPAAAFTIHGAPALFGALFFPVFMLPALGGAGFDEGSGFATQIAAQAVAVLAITLWTAVATVIAALMVSMVVPMRETKG